AYLWSTGATTPMITVKPYVSDSFALTVSNFSNGVNCYDDTSVFVRVSDCNHIYLPNAFTPNGDGMNDFIGPVGILEGYESYELIIFDRWGQQVFYSSRFTELWDGRIRGKDAPCGTYPYLIVLKDAYKPRDSRVGVFHLIR
ncbi:MAG TPA: gliding motility-associated C-terminal domain-containing protein, partial [Bacteroidales bacterium]|nr:gliding motility-associated C-terminal domain-containing protein [Bacteroidales bacterium]